MAALIEREGVERAHQILQASSSLNESFNAVAVMLDHNIRCAAMRCSYEHIQIAEEIMRDIEQEM